MNESRGNLLIASHALGCYPCYAFLVWWETMAGSPMQLHLGMVLVFALAPVTVPLMFAMYLVAPASRYLPLEVAAAAYAGSIVASFFILRWLGRRARNKRLGKCVRCGYDLRATPERCPECGENRSSDQSSGSSMTAN